MKFSIALCTYNGEDYLQDQLDSISLQTRLPDEMVICDDCSSDRTWAILENFASSAPFPVFLHKNTENLGSTQNFSQAISLCQGDIIALCDQDDVWMPEKLAKLEAAFADQNIGLVFSDALIVDENLKSLGCQLWSVSLKSKIQRPLVSAKLVN